jgi:hypothetical protein
MLAVGKWMELKIIMLNKMSQIEKDSITCSRRISLKKKEKE